MKKKVLFRQLQISWIPLILAITYASIAYFTVQEDKRSFMTFVNYLSATFFFLMWIVGQYLRTSKELNDKSNYQNLQTGIDDLRSAISKLQSFTFATSPKTLSKTENKMLSNAKSAIDSGYVLAGLMQAGVAFEQAIISKAERLGIQQDRRLTVSKLLNELKHHFDRGTIAEFYAVWKLRNQLVHLTDEAAMELENSPHLIKYFEWAINELEN